MQIDNAEIYTYKVPESSMKLTEEQIKENLACYEQAMRTLNFENIEVQISDGEWVAKTRRDTFDCRTAYRRKPAPKLVPYTAETWPLDADWVRQKGSEHAPARPIDMEREGIYFSLGQRDGFRTWTQLLSDYELTRDHGKTWEPCGRLA